MKSIGGRVVFAAVALVGAVWVGLAGARGASLENVGATTTKPVVAAGGFRAVPTKNVPNVYVVTDKLLAGAQPEGDEGFAALKALGIKTIISVDGTKPDVERARKFGLRYVHLPITYATVTEEEGEEIAKAIHDLPGPIYLHCHHGKHRSAAAAAVACVFAETLPPERAEALLATMGTGKEYAGLWKAAREARPHDMGEIEATKVTFVETKQIPPLADAMVGVDGMHDDLGLMQKAGWAAPKEHPDLDPSHEALLLKEQFHEIGRTEAVKAKPEAFRKMLAGAEEATGKLEAVLAERPIDRKAADAAMANVGTACTSCHKVYRN